MIAAARQRLTQETLGERLGNEIDCCRIYDLLWHNCSGVFKQQCNGVDLIWPIFYLAQVSAKGLTHCLLISLGQSFFFFSVFNPEIGFHRIFWYLLVRRNAPDSRGNLNLTSKFCSPSPGHCSASAAAIYHLTCILKDALVKISCNSINVILSIHFNLAHSSFVPVVCYLKLQMNTLRYI